MFFSLYFIFDARASFHTEYEASRLHTGYDDEPNIPTILATVGDIFFFTHDWFFTIQYVESSLNLPIIVKIFEDDESSLG